MMAMTTSNSISVKPARCAGRSGTSGWFLGKECGIPRAPGLSAGRPLTLCSPNPASRIDLSSDDGPFSKERPPRADPHEFGVNLTRRRDVGFRTGDSPGRPRESFDRGEETRTPLSPGRVRSSSGNRRSRERGLAGRSSPAGGSPRRRPEPASLRLPPTLDRRRINFDVPLELFREGLIAELDRLADDSDRSRARERPRWRGYILRAPTGLPRSSLPSQMTSYLPGSRVGRAMVATRSVVVDLPTGLVAAVPAAQVGNPARSRAGSPGPRASAFGPATRPCPRSRRRDKVAG